MQWSLWEPFITKNKQIGESKLSDSTEAEKTCQNSIQICVKRHEKMVDFISPTCKQEKLLFHAILSVGYVQQTPSSTTPS